MLLELGYLINRDIFNCYCLKISLLVLLLASSFVIQSSYCCDSSSCLQPTTTDSNSLNCSILFREEGSSETFCPTCVEPNTFVVSFNRTKPIDLGPTDDSYYYSTIFDDNLPPYVRVNCKSSYPTDIEFDGVGALDFFRVWKSQESIENDTRKIYNLNAEVLLTPQSTGKYIFYSIENKSLSTSFFVFAEKNTKPYLIGAISSQSHQLKPIKYVDDGKNKLLLPCVTSNYNVSVHLYFSVDKALWFPLDKAIHKPKEGIMIDDTNATALVTYKCTTGSSNETEKVDFVNIEVDGTEERIRPLNDNHTLTITFTDDSVKCTSSLQNSSQDVQLSNIYSRNPTESRLLVECLIKGNSYCGSHSYHVRKDADNPPSDPNCLNSNCSQIEFVHEEGLVYCSQGSKYIFNEYFNGLDGKIYTDWKNAPTDALIKPILAVDASDNQTYKTNVLYSFKCVSVGIFLKEPYILSVKYFNGSIVQLSETAWWAWHTDLYLSPDMEEIFCSDNLWTTNEMVNSSIKLNVIDTGCQKDQFKCKNSQCVLNDLRCNGFKDCVDGSDEKNCSSHKCKEGYFQCNTGICIPLLQKCDNVANCDDGSDETNSTCHDTKCNFQEFKCTSGQCIPVKYVCGGISHCLDGSDENATSCLKYHPVILNSNKETMKYLTEWDVAELICEVGILPDYFKPNIEWHFNGKNITDVSRLWKDFTGFKLSLKFPNVSKSDEGEYACNASNRLGDAEYKLNIGIKEADTSCTHNLDYKTCALRNCYYDHDQKVCLTKDEFHNSKTTSTTTTTTTINPTTSTTTTVLTTSTSPNSITDQQHGSSNPLKHNSEKNQSSSGNSIGVVFLALIFIMLGIGGIFSGWKFYNRRRLQQPGSARLTNDDRVELRHDVY